MKIIGFVGPKGSGKDTAADMLIELKKAKGRMSFAWHLKDICSKVFGIPPAIFADPLLKERPFAEMANYKNNPIVLTNQALKQIKKECTIRLSEVVPGTDFMRYNIDRASVSILVGQVMETPRQLLQVVGTEFIRERVYKRWHLEAAFSDESMAKLSPNSNYCVTDVRFVNEYEFLKEKFGDDFICYYVERPEQEAILAKATHPSELGVKEIRQLIGEGAVIKNDGTLEDFKAKLEALPLSVIVSRPSAKGSRFVFGNRK